MRLHDAGPNNHPDYITWMGATPYEDLFPLLKTLSILEYATYNDDAT